MVLYSIPPNFRLTSNRATPSTDPVLSVMTFNSNPIALGYGTSLSAVRERPLNLITHSLGYGITNSCSPHGGYWSFSVLFEIIQIYGHDKI